MNKFIFLSLLVLLALLFFFRRLSSTEVSQWPSEMKVKVGPSELKVSVAQTAPEKERGLSGRESLAESEGMLFAFNKLSYPKFWMKEMKFAIDIIWIGEDLKVVDLTENVSPQTYPQTFSPKVPVRYVLEVEAGWVRRHGVGVGDLAAFN